MKRFITHNRNFWVNQDSEKAGIYKVGINNPFISKLGEVINALASVAPTQNCPPNTASLCFEGSSAFASLHLPFTYQLKSLNHAVLERPGEITSKDWLLVIQIQDQDQLESTMTRVE